MEFELKGKEFIQLNQLLKNLSLVGSGGEAKIRITDGEALVNGEEEFQIRKKVRAGDTVEFNGNKISVKA